MINSGTGSQHWSPTRSPLSPADHLWGLAWSRCPHSDISPLLVLYRLLTLSTFTTCWSLTWWWSLVSW